MIILNRWSDDIECPENYPIYVGNSSEEIWTTKSGAKIRVGDMTDKHIYNCLNFVKNELWKAIFKEELNKRGVL